MHYDLKVMLKQTKKLIYIDIIVNIVGNNMLILGIIYGVKLIKKNT